MTCRRSSSLRRQWSRHDATVPSRSVGRELTRGDGHDDAHPQAPQRRDELRPDPGDPRRQPVEVAEGEIVTVLGANGAGKTTILKTISGIIDPRKGQVDVRGPARSSATRPDRIVRARHQSTCPRAARSSRCCRCATICAWAPTRAATATASRATSRRCSAISRSCASAPAQEAGQLSGGAAADAGDRARADGAAQADAARRAEPRPVAAS